MKYTSQKLWNFWRAKGRRGRGYAWSCPPEHAIRWKGLQILSYFADSRG